MADAIELAAGLARPFETLRLFPYFDPIGYPTQGYGRLLTRQVWGLLGRAPETPEERKAAYLWLAMTYPKIDEETAEKWLLEDLTKANASVRRLCPNLETPQQEAALTDFAFNCGAGNLQISKLRTLVNRGDAAAADEFLSWVYARGTRLPGLVRRRKAEQALFLGEVTQCP
jgi:lysozyme